MNRSQLADAMLKGSKAQGVYESRDRYIATSRNGQFCRACALGCALIGKHDGDFYEAEKVYDQQFLERRSCDAVQVVLAGLLDISPALAIEIEHKHLNGMRVEQIAAWLKGGDHA